MAVSYCRFQASHIAQREKGVTDASSQNDDWKRGNMKRKNGCGKPARTKSMGVYGLPVLTCLYKLGCATAQDVGAVMRLDRRVVNRQLLALLRSGYVERIRARPSWQGSERGLPDIYHLSRTGVPVGGGEAGIEDEEEARTRYRRCRAVYLLSHRMMGTRLVAHLAEATEKAAEYSITDHGAEHAPGFPLRMNQKTSHISAPGLARGLKKGDLQPDGLVDIAIDLGKGRGAHGLRLLLELETGSRGVGEVFAKIVAYLAYFEARCRTAQGHPTPEDPRGYRYLAEPEGGWPAVVFVFPREKAALRAHHHAWNRLEENEQYQAWIWRMQNQHGIDPARFFLFASLEAAGAHPAASLGRIYTALETHRTATAALLPRVSPHDVALLSASINRHAIESKGA